MNRRKNRARIRKFGHPKDSGAARKLHQPERQKDENHPSHDTVVIAGGSYAICMPPRNSSALARNQTSR
jgi:hypothetical protein